jgi:DNA-directed RNA polymerase subunit K/omega
MPEDKEFDKLSPVGSKEKSVKSSLEKLISDTKLNRYQLIPLVLRWTKELEKHSEKKISPDELVNQALNDILSDKVKLEEITKLIEGKRR